MYEVLFFLNKNIYISPSAINATKATNISKMIMPIPPASSFFIREMTENIIANRPRNIKKRNPTDLGRTKLKLGINGKPNCKIINDRAINTFFLFLKFIVFNF